MREKIAQSLHHFLFGSLCLLLFLLPFKFGVPFLEQETFLFPYQFSDWFSLPYWPTEFFLFAAILLLFAWVLKNVLQARIEIHWNGSFALVFGFLLVGWLTAQFSVYPYASKMVAQQLTAYAILFFLATQIFGNKEALFHACVWFVAGAILISLFGLYQHFFSLQETLEWIQNQENGKNSVHHNVLSRLEGKRAFGTFIYPNSLAGYLLLAFPVSLGLWFSLWKERKKRAFFFFALLWIPALLFLFLIGTTHPFAWLGSIVGVLIYPLTLLMCLAMTFSKGAFAALGGTLILFACWFFYWRRSGKSGVKDKKWSWKSSLLTGGLVMPLVFLFWHYRSFWAHRLGMPTLQNRWDYWQAGIKMWQDYPLLGAGPGTFGTLYPTYKNLLAENTQLAHNDYLQIALEMGSVGLVLLLLFLGLVFVKGLKTTSQEEEKRSPLILALLWGEIALTIHHFGDFNFYIPSLGGCEWIFLGILSTQLIRTTIFKISLSSFWVRSGVLVSAFLVFYSFTTPLSHQLQAKYSFDLAKRHYRTQQWQEALKWIDQAIESEPQNATYRVLEGNIWVKLKQPQKAILAYKEASQNNPYLATPYLLETKLLLSKWNHSKSEATFKDLLATWRAALERIPTQTRYRLELAIFLEKNGLLEQALIEYMAILSKDSQHKRALEKSQEIGGILAQYFKDQA